MSFPYVSYGNLISIIKNNEATKLLKLSKINNFLKNMPHSAINAFFHI